MSLLKAIAAGSKALFDRAERKSMSPAQALGRYYNPGQPVRKYDFDPDTAVVDGFKACVWVFACVSLHMNAVCSAPWVVKRRVGGSDSDEWEKVPDDWRVDLIESPNEDMDREFAMAWMTSHLCLGGEAPIKVTRSTDRENRVLEMYPLHPHRFSPIAGTDEYVSGYEAYERGTPKKYRKDEIIFVKLPDPDNILRGCGWLQAAWSAVRADVAGQDWRANIFERGGIPPGAVSDENITTTEQMDEAVALVESSWSKAGKGARPMVWGRGTSWIPFSYNATDLQFLEGRQFTVSEICSAFKVHPALFMNEAATYDNMRTAIQHYWRNGSIPLLKAFRGAFNLGLIPKNERKNLYIDYDLSEIDSLQEDAAAQILTFKEALANGLSRVEAASLSRLNLDRTAGDDVPLVMPGLRPLADVAAGDSGFEDGSELDLPKDPMLDSTDVQDVQDVEVTAAAVLNGAQVTAATEIVRSVAAGEIPRDAGLGQIQILFNLSEQQANEIMGSAGLSDVPTTPNPNPAMQAASAQKPAAVAPDGGGVEGSSA